jgi:DNA-binding response OmpR family regulator
MRRRLLVVEDGSNNASRLRGILDPTRYLVQSARSLLAAWTVLGWQHPPDLVVLDLVLCDGNGLDLCREIKARWPALPVLVVTTRDGVAARNYVRRAGADGLVAKPFDPDHLAAAIQGVLGGAPGRPAPRVREATPGSVRRPPASSWRRDTRERFTMADDRALGETRWALTLLARMLAPHRPDRVRGAAAAKLGQSAMIGSLPDDLCDLLRWVVIDARKRLGPDSERPRLRLVPRPSGRDDRR